jgi:ribosomal protein S18 acetylase RimI-like enzyme
LEKIDGDEKVLIRTASVQDAETMAALSRRTFAETFADKNSEENMTEYLSTNCTAEILSEELKEADSTFFLALRGNGPVGFAKLRRSEIPVALKGMRAIEIQRLYVVKTMIGRKIGMNLMKRCLDMAEQEKYETVWLGVWEHNYSAIEFYKRFGFEIFGSHLFEVGRDPQTDLLMKKRIS